MTKPPIIYAKGGSPGRPVILDGVTFASRTQAARVAGVTLSRISQLCRRAPKSKGVPILMTASYAAAKVKESRHG